MMIDKIYIICDRNGVVGYRKNKPSLTSGQIAVRLEVRVPSAYFDRFVPAVTVDLPEPPPLTDTSVTYEPLEVVGPEPEDPLDKLFEDADDE